MAKTVKHRGTPADDRGPRAADPAPEGISARLILVWGWLAIYLAIYFLWPLTSGPLAARHALRRGHLWLGLLLGDETFGRWFEDASLSSLAERGQILAAAAAILLVATAAGWVALWALVIDRRLTRLETFVFSAGVGLNLISLATLAVGLAGALWRGLFLTAGLAIVLTAAAIRFGRPADAAVGDVNAMSRLRLPASVIPLSIRSKWLWLAAPFVAVLLASAMLPPFDFDVREYHLQAPKEFFQAGEITFLPHNVYANMPLGTEMLSLAAMVVTGDWWLGALVGKTLISCFAPLTALALYAAGRRLASPSVGVLAAILYISIPWVALISTQGLVEGAFAFYLFAAYYAVLTWRDCEPRDAACWPLLMLAGFLAARRRDDQVSWRGLRRAAIGGVRGLRTIRRTRGRVRRLTHARASRRAGGVSIGLCRRMWSVVREERRADGQPHVSAALPLVRRRKSHAGKRSAVVAGAPPAEP